jgi:hypothetical protein
MVPHDRWRRRLIRQRASDVTRSDALRISDRKREAEGRGTVIEDQTGTRGEANRGVGRFGRVTGRGVGRLRIEDELRQTARAVVTNRERIRVHGADEAAAIRFHPDVKPGTAGLGASGAATSSPGFYGTNVVQVKTFLK